MESKRAVVRYMKEHGREKDTAAWLQQEYGDNLPAFPVTADGAAGDVPWPKVQRRIAQLIQRDEFFTEQERDEFEDIDRWRYGSGCRARHCGRQGSGPGKAGQRPLYSSGQG